MNTTQALLAFVVVLIITVIVSGTMTNWWGLSESAESRTTTLTENGAVTERFLTTLKVPTYQSIKQHIPENSNFDSNFRFQGVIKEGSLTEMKSWLQNKSRPENWKEHYNWHNLKDRASYDAFVNDVKTRLDSLEPDELDNLKTYVNEELDFEFNIDTGMLTGPGNKEYAPITGRNLRPDNSKRYIHLDVYVTLMMILHQGTGWEYSIAMDSEWAPLSLDEYTRKKSNMPNVTQTRSARANQTPPNGNKNGNLNNTTLESNINVPINAIEDPGVL